MGELNKRDFIFHAVLWDRFKVKTVQPHLLGQYCCLGSYSVTTPARIHKEQNPCSEETRYCTWLINALLWYNVYHS